MAKLVNIGFGNVVNTDKIVTIINPDSAPAKRIVQRAKESERIVDATQGRRTKSIQKVQFMALLHLDGRWSIVLP